MAKDYSLCKCGNPHNYYRYVRTENFRTVHQCKECADREDNLRKVSDKVILDNILTIDKRRW